MVEKHFLFLKCDLSVVMSVRMTFFGPKYKFAVQILRVSRCPVNLLVIERDPFAMALIFPCSSLYKKTNLSFSKKFLCPRMMNLAVNVFLINPRVEIFPNIRELQPLN